MIHIVLSDVDDECRKARPCVLLNSASQQSTMTSANSSQRQTTHRAVGKAAVTSQRLLKQMDGQMSSIAAMAQHMEDQFNNTRLVSCLISL